MVCPGPDRIARPRASGEYFMRGPSSAVIAASSRARLATLGSIVAVLSATGVLHRRGTDDGSHPGPYVGSEPNALAEKRPGASRG